MKGEGKKRQGHGGAVHHSAFSIQRSAFGGQQSAVSIYSSLRPRHGRGFTLIEMLVVLMIMGLFVGLVTAIMRPDDRALLRVEAERLAQLLDLAAVQARLTGKPTAWIADGPGYRFWQLNEDTGWSEVRDGDLLRARTLPPGMLIAGLQVENMRPQGAMRLEFVPYGPALSYNVDMALGAERYTVAASPVGDVRVVPGAGKTNGDMALQ